MRIPYQESNSSVIDLIADSKKPHKPAISSQPHLPSAHSASSAFQILLRLRMKLTLSCEVSNICGCLSFDSVRAKRTSACCYSHFTVARIPEIAHLRIGNSDRGVQFALCALRLTPRGPWGLLCAKLARVFRSDQQERRIRERVAVRIGLRTVPSLGG